MEIVVNPNKILKYLLLDPDKRKFFRMFGSSEKNWEQLQSDLISLARNNPKRLRLKTSFDEEYEIGNIIAPSGREISVKSGWMIDAGAAETLRFVTAYPE